ncbi:hypothetical protein ACPV3S_01250 [Photobacterium damselae]|uniref:hypothetical protein n=1 Tax=Photobacterium damselae TaxID=38293 RepID=UPI0040684481
MTEQKKTAITLNGDSGKPCKINMNHAPVGEIAPPEKYFKRAEKCPREQPKITIRNGSIKSKRKGYNKNTSTVKQPKSTVKNGSIKPRTKIKSHNKNKAVGRPAEDIVRDLYNKRTDIVAKGENIRHLTNYQRQKRQQWSHKPSYSRTDYTRLQGSWGYSGGKCSPK